MNEVTIEDGRLFPYFLQLYHVNGQLDTYSYVLMKQNIQKPSSYATD